jgi:hypothetical protein
MGGDMMGGVRRERGGLFGGGIILEEGTVFLVWHIFWGWEFGFGGSCESLQGAPGCWGF